MSMLKILETSYLMLHNAYLIDKNDLYNYDEDSDEWKGIKKVMCRVNTKNKDKIEQINRDAQKQFQKSTIFFTKAINLDSYLITNVIKMAGFAIKFKLNSDENLMEFESKESTFNSNKLFILDFIELSNIKLFKKIRERAYPKIELREKIYMRKDYPEITLEYIKTLLMKIYGNEIITKNFGDAKQKERIILDENKRKNFPLWAQKLNKEDKPYFVSTRLINSYEFKNFGMKKIKTSFFGLIETRYNKVESQPINAIILFIHGGGFLRFKHFFHEGYLRELCNKLNIPILGIDYAAAPEHPYPEGLNDCFQMYMWMLDNCEKELGFKPEKIILVGDSSGGNLALALTFLIIAMNEYENKNIRLPDIILPIYPCCHTGIRNMNLTLAGSFEDLMLNIKALHYINSVYRGYYPNELDPFLNPVEVSENLLKKLPPSIFMTGTHDPLRDDTIRLIRKICNIPGMSVKNYEFTNYQHGFLGNENNMISGPPKEIFCKEINEFLKK
jgi:acetyl esterase/lipase